MGVMACRADSREKKRQEVVYEFVQTEIGYYRHLRILESVFKHPFVTSQGLDKTDLLLLFGNVNRLSQMHRDFATTYARLCVSMGEICVYWWAISVCVGWKDLCSRVAIGRSPPSHGVAHLCSEWHALCSHSVGACVADWRQPCTVAMCGKDC